LPCCPQHPDFQRELALRSFTINSFTDEQVNVVGHDDVARERESVAVTHFAQNLHKQILRARRDKQGQSPVATAGDEVEVV
jgi:hypothetical protein